MKPLSVVVAQSNSKTGETLAKSLYNHFRAVNVVSGVEELRYAIPRHRADVAIVDLELANLHDSRNYHRLHTPPRRREDVDGSSFSRRG